MDADERAMLHRFLTPEARERLDRILREHPDLKESIEKTLVSLLRVGMRNSWME